MISIFEEASEGQMSHKEEYHASSRKVSSCSQEKRSATNGTLPYLPYCRTHMSLNGKITQRFPLLLSQPPSPFAIFPLLPRHEGPLYVLSRLRWVI